MPALQTLGLVIMAALVVSIGIIGYVTIQAIMRDRAAQDALMKVGNACQSVITIGGTQVVDVEIPSGYTMSFTDNKIGIGGHVYPQDGFSVAFAENTSELTAQSYNLSITVSEGRLVVTWIS
jgi:Flp pilus assembly protein CpaB